MVPAPATFAEPGRAQSLKMLNQHLATAIALRERMRQSPRHVRGPDFIMFDRHCGSVAQLMETCAKVIAGRLTDLGGMPTLPVKPGPWSIEIRDPDFPATVWPGPARTEWVSDKRPLAGPDGPLDDFAQAVLDAAGVAEAYGDGTTANLLAQVWRDVDRHLWVAVTMPDNRIPAP